MKHLPLLALGHEITVVLKSGQELQGTCVQISDDYVKIEYGRCCVWHAEAADILAFGIKGDA